MFPLGTTAVSCQASDAMARQASCSFKVTLKGFSIALKKYDVLGDSFTSGENGQPAVFDVPNSFPTKLQAAFDAVYPGQGATVVPHGDPGRRMSDIVANLVKYVTADAPDGVLVEGGYNDLLGDCGLGPVNATSCENSMINVQLGFRDCIRKSKEHNVAYVFVATMTPPGPVLPGAPRDRRISNDAILQANALIRQTAAAEGAVLADVYPLFVGHEAEYVDTDGLHLRPAGYQVMADVFFAAIQKTIPQTPLAGFRFPR
jgi:lysophospholipase L1-like esterase